MSRVGALLVLLVGIGGCASSNEEQNGGNSGEARERRFQFNSGDELAKVASFNLSCPKEMMEAQVMQRVGMFAQVATAGVRGCGKRAMFARTAYGAWVLNSPVTADAPPPPPAAPPPAAQ